MARRYWRIGTKIFTELIEKGYPYVYGGAITGYNEENGKKTRRKEYISNLSKIKIGDILVAGGVEKIYYIGEVIERPVFLFQHDGPAWDASFEANYNIHEVDNKIKEAFNEVFEENEDEQWDIVCMKTIWYTIPKGLRMPEQQPPGSCNEITNKKVIKYINDKIKQTDRRMKMEDRISMVEENKNVIFTGAPGTGKTYLAKEIAEKIVGHNNEKSNVEFVQFHPSYDYTDFVEGLRPVDKGNMQIGFELKMGIFKAFCQKAQENSKQKFVFIIDEINRGEISKIFGELFFSIDPEYRGTDGLIKTQYSNLIPKDNIFYNGFFVPENVYIIGTMNDIDRSVESFDFAMRRRFTWIEISAEESAENMKLSDKVRKRMFSLNDAISETEGLNSSYHIGGHYFLKLKDDDYEQLWDYHLAPLLREYLRGISDADDKFEALERAYNLDSGVNEDVKDNESN
jgi:5-methylcytosine-specific restriction endonuclease McrBC GTP-binding regulatory subunit McrB